MNNWRRLSPTGAGEIQRLAHPPPPPAEYRSPLRCRSGFERMIATACYTVASSNNASGSAIAIGGGGNLPPNAHPLWGEAFQLVNELDTFALFSKGAAIFASEPPFCFLSSSRTALSPSVLAALLAAGGWVSGCVKKRERKKCRTAARFDSLWLSVVALLRPAQENSGGFGGLPSMSGPL